MLKKVINFFKKQNSFRYIALGFLTVIFVGSGFLMIPGCIKEGVKLHYIDALYTATSAVCVTGLASVDIYDTFTIGGQTVVMLLIQIGGLGITTLGAGLITALRRRISLRERSIIQETFSLSDGHTLLSLFKRVFMYTFVIEMAGFCLSMGVFFRAPDYLNPGQAIFRSLFHSVSSFNNAGFDILGTVQGSGLIPIETNFARPFYNTDVLFNLTTCGLIILGGLGFLVLSDVVHKPFKPKKWSLHTKVVLLMTSILIISGTLLLALTEYERIASGDFSWLGAFFTSVSTRTAGFATYHMYYFTSAGHIIIIILMFIGASPGSTGGGIKTTTLFVLLMGIKSMVDHKKPHAFKYSVSEEAIKKAMTVATLALMIVLVGTFAICMIERTRSNDGTFSATDVLFEVTSAYGTVGLSTGITGYLTVGSKIISIMIMYIGRVGPITIMSSWHSSKDEHFGYVEGIIPIG